MNPKAVNFINVCFLAAAYQFRDLTWKGSPTGGLVESLSSQLGSANMVELVECRITKTHRCSQIDQAVGGLSQAMSRNFSGQ